MSNQPKQYALRSLLSMCIMYTAATGITWDTLSLYAVPLIGEWQVTSAQVMFAITLVAVGDALAIMLACGPCLARFGVRKMLVAGGALTAAGVAIMAVAQSLPVFYAAAVVLGIGLAPLSASTNMVVINSWFARRVGTYVSIPVMCGSIGGILFASVYAFLISTFGWRPTMWITVAVVVLSTMAELVLYKGTPAQVGMEPWDADARETDEQAPETAETSNTAPMQGAPFAQMVRQPRFYVIAAGYFLIGIAGYGVFGNLPLLAEFAGFGAYSGTVVSAGLIGSAATTFLCGYIVDRIGSFRLVALLLGVSIAAMVILLAGGGNLALLYVAAVLLGLGYNAVMIPSGITMREVFGNAEYDKKVALLIGICYMGLAIGPSVFAVFYDITLTYTLSLQLFALLALCAIALVGAGTRGRRGNQ